MKKITIMIGILLISSVVYGSRLVNAKNPCYSGGLSNNFNYKGMEYRTCLPLSIFKDQSDFRIENSEFPLSMSQIIQFAKDNASKVDPEAKWTVQSISLNQYNYSNAIYWYYYVNLRYDNFYLYINIGLNGEQPQIYKIQPILLE